MRHVFRLLLLVYFYTYTLSADTSFKLYVVTLRAATSYKQLIVKTSIKKNKV